MFSGSVFRLAPGTQYEFRLKMSDPDGGGIVRIATAETLAYPMLPSRRIAVEEGGLVEAQRLAIPGTGVCITNCRLQAHYAIHTPGGAENYFIADNVLTGDAQGRFSFSGKGVDFGSDRGECGHAVCYNEITEFADGISYGRGDIDVYNNYIHETVDDFIEPDYSRRNYRIWSNRCYNSMCGFSFQPMKGGPWYMFNNIIVGTYLHAFKVKTITGPSVICGNTILTKSSMLGQGGDLLQGSILNNAWLRITPGPLASGGVFRPGPSPVDIDYNAYGTGGHEPFAKIGYAELRKNNWDEHSLAVDYGKVFRESVQAPAGEPYYSSKLQGTVLPEDWLFEHYLLIPREGSNLIDAGTTLPNVTGPYLGQSPDIGAHELGLGTPWYGPRTWDEELGFAYGVPRAWKKVETLAQADYNLLSCLESKAKEVLLVRENPKIVALIQFEDIRGKARWGRQRQFLAQAEDVISNVLEFQDGFGVRICHRRDNIVLVACQVQAKGVLYVTTRCSVNDWPKAQLDMFCFVRSFFR